LEKEMNLDTEEPYQKFYQRCKELKEKTVSFIEKELAEGKKIIAYGASTKGNTLLQFYGLNNKQINFVADRNPDKWGRKTIGTDIEIISEEKAREMKPDYFLFFPGIF
jgi:translation initiation factor 2B subunit (eIF-2B alpha/beta/delta family)